MLVRMSSEVCMIGPSEEISEDSGTVKSLVRFVEEGERWIAESATEEPLW
jgi:hypothetical protein